MFSGLSENFRIYAHLCFPWKMNLLPKFFYGMVVIGSLSMVGDGDGCEGRWEGVGRALAGGEGLGWESDL